MHVGMAYMYVTYIYAYMHDS